MNEKLTQSAKGGFEVNLRPQTPNEHEQAVYVIRVPASQRPE